MSLRDNGENKVNVPRHGDAPTDDTVEQALAAFLDAFMRLDRDQVRACFADEATVFHPWGGSRQTEFWNATFDEWCPTQAGPPSLDIQPKDVDVHALGDVAIVTFHFRRDPAVLGRRTFVWRKSPSGWKIIHLHASNLPADEAPMPR
jgi:ketosteroid isomerase-like protein